MGYVKGCDVVVVSNYIMKKIENGKYVMNNDLKYELSVEDMKNMLEKANRDFVTAEGKVDCGRPSGQLFMITKKIDKQRVILGVAAFERVAGAPSTKTGIAKWFEPSRDRYVLTERLFVPGFEQEEEYFDESILEHFKGTIGLGQAMEAEYLDKLVAKTDKKTFFGHPITQATFLVLMTLMWGTIFQNYGIGLCFAFIFSSSYTMITCKTKSVENVIEAE